MDNEEFQTGIPTRRNKVNTTELIKEMLKAMVDKPEELTIKVVTDDNQVRVNVDGGKELGKIIGKKGATVIALRTVFSAIFANECGKSFTIGVGDKRNGHE